MTSLYVEHLESRKPELELLKSAFNAKNFIRIADRTQLSIVTMSLFAAIWSQFATQFPPEFILIKTFS